MCFQAAALTMSNGGLQGPVLTHQPCSYGSLAHLEFPSGSGLKIQRSAVLSKS